jgi:hypothetical protein
LSFTQVSSPSAAGAVATSDTQSLLLPSASAYASPLPSSAKSNSDHTTAPAHSNAGAIAGGIIGAIVLLGLIALGAFFFMRRRRNRTAPSAEFLTVYPPETPFSRLDSLRSTGTTPNFPPASFTTEKYSSYPEHIMNYP